MSAAAIPWIIAAASTGAEVYNNVNTARKQDAAAAEGIRAQGVKQREANALVDKQLSELATSNADDERQTAQDQFLAQLRKTRQAADGSMPTVAGASDRYTQDVNDRSANASAQAERTADLMSRINAPMMQRQGEAQQSGRLASDIGRVGQDSKMQDFLTQLRIKGINKNPYVSALSGLGNAYAGYSLGKVNGGNTPMGLLAGE